MADLPTGPERSEVLIYQTQDGQTRVQVRLADETVWLTQRQMAELFEKDVRTINDHIRNVFDEGELPRESTIRKYRIVQTEGARQIEREVEHYNLDVIISVGYRVRSHRGTQFRIWATQRLREYIIKGFTLDDRRLAEGRSVGADYFQELLERIRAIRASERRFYQKITDIYATALDYDPKHPLTNEFYSTVQNKLHWAIHGRTAAEIISLRADASKPNMGLNTWKNAPGGPLRREDVKVAKNYLNEDELRRLNRLVTQYLDFAEAMAERRRPMTMAAWKEKLDAFLQVNEHEILTHAGRVSHEEAVQKALGEYERFDAARRAFAAENPVSDFDRLVEETRSLEEPPQEERP
jgi:hypothetical protein